MNTNLKINLNSLKLINKTLNKEIKEFEKEVEKALENLENNKEDLLDINKTNIKTFRKLIAERDNLIKAVKKYISLSNRKRLNETDKNKVWKIAKLLIFDINIFEDIFIIQNEIHIFYK